MDRAPSGSPSHEPPRTPTIGLLTEASSEPSPTLPSRQDTSPSELAKSRVLPVPSASVTHGNLSQSSFVLPQAGNKAGESAAFALVPEVAKADIYIAADGSFVQTSSALAARELKKAYDQILREKSDTHGVLRSPYAITAVQDASGNSVFRIVHRELLTENTELTETPPEPSTSYSPGHAVGPRRKARLSVQDFLPTSMFKPHLSGNTTPRNPPSLSIGSGSPTSTTAGSPSSMHYMTRNKLRKQRSNSDLHIRGAGSLSHIGSSASGDGPAPVSPPPRSENFAMEIRDEITAGADAFSQVLAWSSELVTDPVAPSRKSAKSSAPPADEHHEALTPGSSNPLPRRPSVSTSAALNTSAGDTSAPFGENVRYTAPTRRSAIFLAPKAPQLREVQSFESGLTARAGDDKDASPGTPKSKPPPASQKPREEAFSAARSQARFSTSVFDVLQTYRGLPLPSTLSELSTGATIKLSTTDSANPKDDPRFVIWGEIQPEGSIIDDTSHSASSHDVSASSSSGPTRKRSNARPPHSNSDTPSLASEVVPQTVVIAATVERWIAQLTSELNYDELLNFLLTYRTYISPVDLCHLLICRFHWALEQPSSHQDDMVRRIVRVRTFIAMRYWLLTFFREDFLPNVELCQLFTSWLNALFRDPALGKHPDALSIVRKLKKIVRECKAAHSRHERSGLGRPSIDTRPAQYRSLNGVIGELAQGSMIGASEKKGGGEKVGEEIDDSEVDLDFASEANPIYDYAADEGTSSSLHRVIFSSDSVRARPPITPIPPVQGRVSATPSANSILLSQPLSTTILGHVKSTAPGTDLPLTQIPSSLPAQHSAISRAFVNTIGRLGRWKRVLNSRSGVPTPHCNDMSAFDLELNATGDLLFVHGGVEEYLKMLNLSQPPVPNLPPPPPQPEPDHLEKIDQNTHPVRPPGLGLVAEEEVNTSQPMKPVQKSPHLDPLIKEDKDVEAESSTKTESRDPHSSNLSVTTDNHSLVTGSLASEVSVPPTWAPDIVSLDDYNLSDSDSSSHSSARVRRPPRRLPLRRDFQFVRHSTDTVSSLGICSHSSIASSVRSRSESLRSVSATSSTAEGHSLVTGIQGWQIELIDTDDEDEAGDAEAALRRLEGQIDADRQREKDLKVGRWLRTAHQRDHDSAGNSGHSASLASDPEAEVAEDAQLDSQDNDDLTVSVSSMHSAVAKPAGETTTLLTVESSRTITNSPVTATATTALATATTLAVQTTSNVNAPSTRDRSGSVESAQMPTTSRPTSRRPSILGRTSRGPAPSKFGIPNVPASHRSFILMHRSETLAQQFSIIEAELFAKIKFEELISHQWGQSIEDVNIRDWTRFVKERAKLKNSGTAATDRSVQAKLSAILALRARFDLLVNFTASEILLTHPSERVIVVEKFIRIAWKTYVHNNFSTLVAIMAGLQTRWVNQAMTRHWHKVGIWEQRLFDDLRNFAMRAGEFIHLRTATTALIDARPLGPAPQDGVNVTRQGLGSSSKSKAGEVRDLPACVPFLGMYLAQLYEHERLPDFIDPTAPTEPVLIDPETGNLSSPSQPDVFSNLHALPENLDLEPLINVHKQRLIAGVIKSFVAGQHLATNIHFEVDHKSWHKCFRLRSLEPDELHSLAKTISDT